jgi:hypothetical protein
MKRLLVALLSVAFAWPAAAQTAGPQDPIKTKQQDVAGAISQGDNSASTQATAAEQARNVKASKQTARLSKEEKAKYAKDATRLNVNPENSSGQAATAAMQKQTVSQSKAAQKQNTQLKSKQGKQQLEQELQKKSTP